MWRRWLIADGRAPPSGGDNRALTPRRFLKAPRRQQLVHRGLWITRVRIVCDGAPTWMMSAARLAGLLEFGRRMALGRQHDQRRDQCKTGSGEVWAGRQIPVGRAFGLRAPRAAFDGELQRTIRPACLSVRPRERDARTAAVYDVWLAAHRCSGRSRTHPRR